MAVGAGLCMYDVVVKKIHVRYLISFPYEFLYPHSINASKVGKIQ